MRYFLIEPDQRYIDIPRVKNWYQLFQKRKIDKEKFDTIPERMILPIIPNQNVMYLPIIFYPCFLIKEQLKDCIKLYEPNLEFKEFIILDSKFETFQNYFYPNLKRINCLTLKTTFNLDHSELIDIEIDEQPIGDCSIFQIGQVNSQYIAVRLDVLESLLRRGAEGITVKELSVRRKAL